MKLVILLLFLSSAVMAEYVCTQKYKTELREGPGNEFTVKEEISRFTPLRLVKDQGDWLQVADYYGNNYWVAKEQIDREGKCVMVTEAMNVDQICPNTREDMQQKKSTIYQETLKVLEVDFNCCKVKDNQGRIFWVNGQYLWPKEGVNKIMEL